MGLFTSRNKCLDCSKEFTDDGYDEDKYDLDEEYDNDDIELDDDEDIDEDDN